MHDKSCCAAILSSIFAGAVIACSPQLAPSQSNTDQRSIENCDGSLGLPRVLAGSAYQQWHLLVHKSGSMTWNGQDVDEEKLINYMKELADMPPSAGNLVIHLEPEATCVSIHTTKRIVRSSPLCSKDRCLQDKWNYYKPIVN